MSDFAGGASGFPMTFFGGKYSGEAHVSAILKGVCFGLFIFSIFGQILIEKDIL